MTDTPTKRVPILLWQGLAVAVLGVLACGVGIVLAANPVHAVRPRLALPAVVSDADDCAIWVHPTDPSRSLVLGNDKSGQRSGLYAYGLDGKVRQFVPIRDPSNLDVRYGMALGGRSVDICAIVARNRSQLWVYTIDPETGKLTRANTSLGQPVRRNRPYGLALYKRPSDGALFAFVSRLASGTDIEQFQLVDDGSGRVTCRLVRRFGGAAIRTHVEGMAVDDELGYLYASDEEHALLKFHADPAKGDALVARFALGDGIKGDREGIAVYPCADGAGYLLVSSQGNSTVKVYAREGNNRFLKTIDTVSSHRTDGLDVTPCAAGPRFPHGFLVCHNSRGKNFVLYDWRAVAGTDLKTTVGHDPRATPARQP